MSRFNRIPQTTRTRRRFLPGLRLTVIAIVGAAAVAACVPNTGFYPYPIPPGGGIVPPVEEPEPPRTESRTFNEPRVGGRWLDVCYAHGACREQRAVNTFCEQQGYQTATSHQSRMTPPLQTNVRIGDQSVCRAAIGNCHRVTTVTCERTG